MVKTEIWVDVCVRRGIWRIVCMVTWQWSASGQVAGGNLTTRLHGNDKRSRAGCKWYMYKLIVTETIGDVLLQS